MFISLHANASLRPALAGATIYSAAFEPRRQRRRRARSRRERVPAIGGGSRDIEFVPWDFAQTAHVERIRQRWRSCSRGAVPRPRFRWRRVRSTRRRSRVLESANMPAVLIEMGLPDEPGTGKAARRRRVSERRSCRRCSTPSSRFREVLDATQRRRSRRRTVTIATSHGHRRAGRRWSRGLAWLLFVGLPRWYAARATGGARRRRRRWPPPPGRKIKARLFYVSGRRDASDRRRAGRRHGDEARAAQAGEIVKAQIAPAAAAARVGRPAGH